MDNRDLSIAKPFLKWAGGKTQLLEQFVEYFPPELKNGSLKNYYEPFLGGGAVFFFIAQNYPIKKAYLSDVNEDLVLTFSVVQQNVFELINELTLLKSEYVDKDNHEREKYFYKIRELCNSERIKINFNGTEYGRRNLNRRTEETIFNYKMAS